MDTSPAQTPPKLGALLNPSIRDVIWESEEAASGGAIAARIAVAGDFIPSGTLAALADHSWRDATSAAASLTADVDVGIANLEAVLNTESLTPRKLTGLGAIVSAPASAIDYLAALNFRLVGLANNHSFDFGAAGIDTTRDAIERRAMQPLGAGRTLADSPEVVVWCSPVGARVGFWAAAKASHDLATPRSPGVEPATQSRAAQAVAELRRRHAQFCVALIHSGVISTNRVDPEDLALLDSIGAAGFQVVAASHSHRVSGHRLIAPPPSSVSSAPLAVFYGLGSLASGYTSGPEEHGGLIIVASLNARGELVRLEARPILLDNCGFAYIPPATIGATILDRFHTLSNEITSGSNARFFYRDVSRGLFRHYLRDARAAFSHSGVPGLARKATRLRMRHIRRLVRKVMG